MDQPNTRARIIPKIGMPYGRYKRRFPIRRSRRFRGRYRRRRALPKRIRRLPRQMADTRARAERKEIFQSVPDFDIVEIGNTTNVSAYQIQMVPSIELGTGHDERIGSKVQLASIRLSGLLKSISEDVFIRYMIVKTKRNDADAFAAPRILLRGIGGVTPNTTSEWNSPVRKRTDDVNDTLNYWGDYLTIVKRGVITMPSFKTTQRASFGINFPVGKRPIVEWESRDTPDDVIDKNQFYLILWCNIAESGEPVTPAATFEDIKHTVTWYDS